MLFLVLLFALSLAIPIFLKREKQKRRVDVVLRDLQKWKEQVKLLEESAGCSDLDDEKLEMANNRLTFAKNAYRVKMKR